MNNLYLNSTLNQKLINNEFIDLFLSNSTEYIPYKKQYLENDNINNEKNNYNDGFFNFNNITERTTFMHRKNVNLKNLNFALSKSIKEFKENQKNQTILTQPKKEIDNKYIKGKVYKKEDIKENIISINDKETYICLIKKNIYYYDYKSQLKINPLYYLVFPRGYSIDLIKRFSYLNTKAIGLKDLERFKTQYNQLNFPKDYPGCLAYQNYMLDKTKRVLIKYYKKPPSKRVNYLKIFNPSPFYPCWNILFNSNDSNNISKSNIYDSLNNINIIPSILYLSNKNLLSELINITKKNGNKYLLNIEITTVGGGIPKYNDLLYLPNEEYVQKYISYIKAKNKINNILFKEKKENEINEDNFDYLKEYDTIKNNFKIIEEKKENNICYGQINKNKYFNSELMSLMKYYNNLNTDEVNKFHSCIINSDLTIKLKDELSRHLLGFITTGLYDYSINKGKGKGFINVKEYETLYNLKKNYNLDFMPILLRKKNSLIYYLCSISLN